MLANPKAKKMIVGVLIIVIGYMFVLPRFQSTEALPTEIPEGAGPGPTYALAGTVYNLSSGPQQQQQEIDDTRPTIDYLPDAERARNHQNSTRVQALLCHPFDPRIWRRSADCRPVYPSPQSGNAANLQRQYQPAG